MMTTPKEKGLQKRDNDLIEENLIFNNSEELVLTSIEREDLKMKLSITEVNENAKSFFKSAHELSQKLKENNNIISLEEIEKL